MTGQVEHLDLLTDFFRTGSKLTYEKGEFIVRPGESASGVFWIESGLVKSYDITKYGEENLLVIRGSNDYLGLTKTLTGDDRHIIYATLAPTTVWVQPNGRMMEFLRDRPEAALPLIQKLAEMYRITSDRVLNLEYRTVRERLISFLLGMAARFGEPRQGGGLIIRVPLRHQDIASSISATRETTGRELGLLERKGLVSSESSCIVLHDRAELQSYLEM